jgi:hypothetical protein
MQLHETSRIPHGHVPAYLPGSASLVEELDQRVLLVLRDGKHLIGVSTETSLLPTNNHKRTQTRESQNRLLTRTNQKYTASLLL